MKKKKLKKKIKHLEKMIENMGYRCDNWAMVARETRDNTTKYSAKVNQLNADISNYGRIINDHASRIAVLEKKETKNEEKEVKKED